MYAVGKNTVIRPPKVPSKAWKREQGGISNKIKGCSFHFSLL